MRTLPGILLSAALLAGCGGGVSPAESRPRPSVQELPLERRTEIWSYANQLGDPAMASTAHAYLTTQGEDAVPILLDLLTRADGYTKNRIAAVLAEIARQDDPESWILEGLIDAAGPESPAIGPILVRLTGQNFAPLDAQGFRDPAHPRNCRRSVWRGWWLMQQPLPERDRRRLLQTFEVQNAAGKVGILRDISRSLKEYVVGSQTGWQAPRSGNGMSDVSIFDHAPTAEEIGQKRHALLLVERGLTDPEPAVRAEAGRLARRLGPFAIPVLIRALDRPEPEVRATAAESLGRIGAAGAVGRLTDAIERDEPLVAFEAALALGWIGDRQAVGPLRRALEREEIRAGAAAALVMLGEPDRFDDLMRWLTHGDRRERAWTLQALLSLSQHQYLMEDASGGASPRDRYSLPDHVEALYAPPRGPGGEPIGPGRPINLNTWWNGHDLVDAEGNPSMRAGDWIRWWERVRAFGPVR